MNVEYEFCQHVNCPDFDKDSNKCSIVCGCNKKTKEFYVWLKRKTGLNNMTELRPFTLWAANAIEKTLQIKDSLNYPAWESLTHAQRYIKMGEEFEEVQEAISGVLIEEKRTPEAIAHLQSELCDLAVTAFMLSGGFDEKISSLKRGRIDNE